MSSTWPRAFVLLFGLVCAASVASAQVKFEVSVPAGKLDAPRDGRVVVYLAGPDRRRGGPPADWDFVHDPMPVYAADAKGVASGGVVKIDATSDHYRSTLAHLPPGRWRAQAVFDWQREASGWSLEPGNLHSSVVAFDLKVGDSPTVALALDEVVVEPKFDRDNVALVEVRSKVLSDFRGREVVLRAGVALPVDYDAQKSYAAIYEVPGFGGTHADALDAARERSVLARRRDMTPRRVLASRTFHIFLDPESPNGHTLFADSAVNGPCGRALVEELIPAIEAKFPALIREPHARLLRGHSSGGWSACWLQTQYDATFGGAWPSAPDPVDFRRFELIDLYAQDSLYVKDGKDLPSVRTEDGTVTLTVRQENAWEHVIAPDNTGGLQWQSWQAVFGSPRGDGHPKELYDIETGAIDKAQLDQVRKYDLRALLANDPAKYAPIWREKIRLIVGGADDYYLDEAVKLLDDELQRLPPTGTDATNKGYVKVVPDRTHDTIYETAEMEAFDREMLEHLDAHGK